MEICGIHRTLGAGVIEIGNMSHVVYVQVELGCVYPHTRGLV